MQMSGDSGRATWRAVPRDQAAVLALLSLIVGLAIYFRNVQLLLAQLFVALFALLIYLLFLRASGQGIALPGLAISFRLSRSQTSKLRALAAVIDFWILAYVGVLGPLHDQLLVRLLVLVPIGLVVINILTAGPAEADSVWWNTQVLGVTLAAAIAVRASSYFGTPGVVGLDPWFHFAVIQLIMTSGSVPATIYSDFPSFHIAGSMVAVVTGVDARLAMFTIGSLLESGTLVFGYLLFNLFADRKISLLAAVLVGFAVSNLHWGFYPITMSLAVPLFIGAVWTFLALTTKTKRKVGFQVAFLLFSWGVILTHPPASLILMAVLTSCWVLLHAGTRVVRSPPSLSGITLVWIFLLGYWLYVSGSFTVFVGYVRGSLAFDNPLNPEVATTGSGTLLSTLWAHLSSYLLELLAIPGILLGIQKKTYRMYGVLGIIGTSLTAYSFILTGGAASVAGYSDRLQVFAEVLVAPAMVLGLYAILKLARSRRVATTLGVALIVVTVFASLTNYQSAATPILLNTGHPAISLTGAELSSLSEIRGFSSGTVISDPFSISYLHWALNSPTVLLSNLTNAKPNQVAAFRIAALNDLSLQPTYAKFDSSIQATRFYDSGSTVAFDVTA